MENKKIVRIETELSDKGNVSRETTFCDTAIILTIKNMDEVIDAFSEKAKGINGVTVTGRTMFLGMNIPDCNFATIVSHIFADMIKKKVRKDGKGVAYTAFMIHEVAEALEHRSIEIMRSASKEDLEQTVNGAMKDIFEMIIDQMAEKAAGKKAEE